MSVVETLELDASQALSVIDTIGATLTQASEAFKVDLADAVSILGSVQPVEITADTSALSTEVDDALGGETATIVVDADTTELSGEIDAALGGESATVPVSADTTEMVSEIETAAAGATAEIHVTADTSEATDQIDALTTSSDQATQSLGGGGGSGGLTAALGAAGGAATGSAEGVGGLSSSVSGATSALGPLAAVVAVLGVTTDKYFDSAVNATAAQTRFNNTFGDTASTVNQIDLGGVDQSLASLNLQLGSSTTQVRNVLSAFGELGKGAGASDDQIATAAKQLEVLSANAAATHPELGSVGDAASSLQRLLGRGGPRLAQYGIALNAVDINAEAAQIALARGSGVVTEFDKRAAGAALATKQLGDGLKDNLDKAADNPIIQLREITAEFAKFTTELGKPLITPVFDILHAAEPVLESIARLFGEVIQAVLPLASAIETALAPLVTGTFNALGSVVAELVPIFQQVGGIILDAIGPALQGLTPLLGTVVTLMGSLAKVAGSVLTDIAPLAKLFGEVLGGLAGLAAAQVGGVITQLAQLVDALSPILELLNPLVLVSKGLQAVGLLQDDGANSSNAFSQAVQANTKDLADLQNQLIDTDKNFASLTATSSEFSKDPAVLDALRRTGVGMKDLQTDLANVDDGFKDFVARAIEAGQVKIQLNGADVTAAQVRSLDGSLSDYLNTSGAVVIQGNGLVSAFASAASAADNQAKANFTAIAASKGLTDEQERQIGSQAKAIFGIDTYSNRLRVLADAQGAAASAESSASDQREAAAQKTIALNSALSQLATQALGAGVSEQDLKNKAEELGVTQDKLKSFTDAVSGAFTDFKNTLVSNLPAIDSVLQKVGDDLVQGTNPQKLIDQLNASTEALVEFQSNVQFLIDNHLTALATVATRKGPEFTNALIQSIKTGRAGLGAELNNNVAVFNQKSQETIDKVNNEFAPQLFDANSAAARGASKAFGTSLDYSGSVQVSMGQVPGAINTTQPSVDAANAASGTAATAAFGNALDPSGQVGPAFGNAALSISAVGEPGHPVPNAANAAGQLVGVAFAEGLATSLSNFATGDNDLTRAAQAIVDLVENKVRDASETHSPSKLFERIAVDWTAGLTHGLDIGTPDVVSATEKQVNAALKAAGKGEQLFFSLADAIAHFGKQSILANGDITGQEAVVSGTEAASRALSIWVDESGRAFTAAEILAGANHVLADSIFAVNQAASQRGPNDGLFAGAIKQTTNARAVPAGATSDLGSPNTTSKQVNIATLNVTAPPGTVDPQAFGAGVAKGIMNTLDVEAFVS